MLWRWPASNVHNDAGGLGDSLGERIRCLSLPEQTCPVLGRSPLLLVGQHHFLAH